MIQTEEGDLSNYVTNGEWDMMDMVVERNVVYYSCCEAPYPDITYHIILRRRPLFYGATGGGGSGRGEAVRGQGGMEREERGVIGRERGGVEVEESEREGVGEEGKG